MSPEQINNRYYYSPERVLEFVETFLTVPVFVVGTNYIEETMQYW